MRKLLLVTLALIPLGSKPMWADDKTPASEPTSAPATAMVAVPIEDPKAPVKGNQLVRGRVARGPAVQNVEQILAMQRQTLRNQRDSWLKNFPEQPVPARAGELVNIRSVKGSLDVDPGAYDYSSGNSRVKVDGSNATWVVNTTLSGKNPAWTGHGQVFTVSRYDWDQTERGQIHTTTIALGTPITIVGTGIGITIVYSQQTAAVELKVSELSDEAGRPGVYVQTVDLNEKSLVELIAKHSEEVHKYLSPLLNRLAMHELMQPGASDVYSAFPDLLPDPAAVAQLNALLPQLDADDLKQREAASLKLARLGAPGIGAALRVDPDKMTAEQQMRIDVFVESERRWPPAAPEKYRGDLNFLIGCLQLSDPAVIVAASKALEQLVGHPVEIDHEKDPEKHLMAIEMLHMELKNQLEAKQKPAVK